MTYLWRLGAVGLVLAFATPAMAQTGGDAPAATPQFLRQRISPGRPMLIISKPAGTLRIEGGVSDLASEVARYYPGGLVEIDPSQVVAAAPAARYDVLPNQAGLIQLVQAGALARNKSGEFLIERKIRFPAELNGAHSVRFLLLRGVPEPDGHPGHSCVIVEETGAPLGKPGGRC
jgi:hypothetical protein